MYKKKNNQLGKYLLISIVIIIFLLIIILFKNNNNNTINDKLEINFTSYNLDYLEFAGLKYDFNGTNGENVLQNIEKEIFMTLYSQYQLLLRLKRTTLYFPYIEKKLTENGLPDDLKYITVAESFLRIDAFSHAGAGGLWQFMPGTGRQYGLLINDYVDERMHHEKSTIAAIKYLKFLENKFKGNRWLALAGYNMGENGLTKTINSQGNDDYFKLILNSETSRYVYRVIAMKYIYENLLKLGIKLEKNDYYFHPEFEIINMKEINDINEFVNELGITKSDLINYNPWIKMSTNNLPVRSDGDQREIKIVKKG